MIDTIYTDGSCIGNPGPWSWWWLGYSNGTLITKYRGTTTSTTNNQMELQAMIESLKFLKNNPETKPVRIFTDSEYVYKWITQYVTRWRSNGRKLSNKQPVKNLELWKCLVDLLDQPTCLEWKWVKAHANSVSNNQVDRWARDWVI